MRTFIGNLKWKTLSSKVKDDPFKNKIKAWPCPKCQCQICSRYLANVGYFLVYLHDKIALLINVTGLSTILQSKQTINLYNFHLDV